LKNSLSAGRADEFDDCDIRELRPASSSSSREEATLSSSSREEVAALSSSRDEVAHSPCVRASNITTREYCNKLLLLKQLDALRDLLKQVRLSGK
jgi:hypothetical protein